MSSVSFARSTHHEATNLQSVFVRAVMRELKEQTAPGEVLVKLFSDRGSTPLASTTSKQHCKVISRRKRHPSDRQCCFSFSTLNPLRWASRRVFSSTFLSLIKPTSLGTDFTFRLLTAITQKTTLNAHKATVNDDELTYSVVLCFPNMRTATGTDSVD